MRGERPLPQKEKDMANRAFYKTIRNTKVDFTFNHGQVAHISYTGCPINNGWKATDLLDINTIEKNSYDKWGMTYSQFQKSVLKQLVPYEIEVTELARSFDYDRLRISIEFEKNTYSISVWTEKGELVMTNMTGVWYVASVDEVVNHYNKDTAFHKVATQMKDSYEINITKGLVLYTTREANNYYVGHLASLDGEGNVGEFKKVNWNTKIA